MRIDSAPLCRSLIHYICYILVKIEYLIYASLLWQLVISIYCRLVNKIKSRQEIVEKELLYVVSVYS